MGFNDARVLKSKWGEPSLKDMWEQQQEFMKLLQEKRNWPEFPVDMTAKASQQHIEGIMFHCMKELFEANNHLKNSKGHRATEITDFDRAAYLEELIDAQHLLLEVAIVSGITLEEYFDVFMKKGDINTDRITHGY